MEEPSLFPGPEWTRQLGVFDLETTGTDVTQDRVVTAHVGVLDASGSVVRARDWLADPGMPIPEGATAVHGVTDAHARAHGRPAARVVAEIADELRRLFAVGIPVVAFNAAYDFSLLAHESRRHGIAPIERPEPVVDPLVLDKACDRYRRGKRTLTAVAEHYGVSFEGAHEAGADAVAAGRVALAIAGRFPERLDGTGLHLHTRQIGWARDQAESLTAYFVKIGRITPDAPLDGGWPVR